MLMFANYTSKIDTYLGALYTLRGTSYENLKQTIKYLLDMCKDDKIMLEDIKYKAKMVKFNYKDCMYHWSNLQKSFAYAKQEEFADDNMYALFYKVAKKQNCDYIDALIKDALDIQKMLALNSYTECAEKYPKVFRHALHMIFTISPEVQYSDKLKNCLAIHPCNIPVIKVAMALILKPLGNGDNKFVIEHLRELMEKYDIAVPEFDKRYPKEIIEETVEESNDEIPPLVEMDEPIEKEIELNAMIEKIIEMHKDDQCVETIDLATELDKHLD